MYRTASTLLYGQSIWKPRSYPSIILLCKTLNASTNLNIFNSNLSSVRILPPPPWQTLYIDFLKFPVTKKEAALNKSLAKSLFLEFFESQSLDTINIFTDGTLRASSAACAFTIPQLNVNGAWKISSNSSIFSAELLAIKKALEFAYNLDFPINSIFTDSVASALAIINYHIDSNYLIADIHNLITNLLSSGIRPKYVWIPSHVSIPGKDRADRLATECLSDLNSPVFLLAQTTNELLSTVHSARTSYLCSSLRIDCPMLLPPSRKKDGPHTMANP